MKAAEVDLFLAVHKVYHEVRNPRSTEWLVAKKDILLRMIVQELTLPADWESQILDAWDRYGKSSATDEDRKRLELQCERLIADGARCLWQDRGLGECSDEFDLGHLVAKSKGGPLTFANTVTECSFHNRSRGDKTVEEFMAHG